ncbi:MAG: hypothetical protein KDA57_18285, partial [Planctomycetales bacterium]|nr:hypothetical protein [Planctomycetales bacterium]
IGPFNNTGGVGFEQVYPPETAVDFSKQYQGKHALIGWVDAKTEAANDVDKIGLIDLNETLGEEKGATAYLAATFNSLREQVLQCRYGTVNATKLWVNGELLVSKNIYHMGGEFDQYIGTAKFRRGENTILLKICQNEQTDSWARQWDVRLRVTDDLGGGVQQQSGPD